MGEKGQKEKEKEKEKEKGSHSLDMVGVRATWLCNA